MNLQERIQCSSCSAGYRPGQFLEENSTRYPLMWASKEASSIEDALGHAQCLQCKSESMVPLWNVLAKFETLSAPPWTIGRPGRASQHRAAKRPPKPTAHYENRSSVPVKPVRTSKAQQRPTRPERSKGHKVVAPPRPSAPAQTSKSMVARSGPSKKPAPPRTDKSMGTMRELLPPEVTKWMVPKGGYSLVMDDEGQPSFHKSGKNTDFVKHNGLRDASTSSQVVVVTVCEEEVEVRPDLLYRAHPDMYPSRTPVLEEVSSEGGQHERRTWIQPGLDQSDTIVFDDTGEPHILHESDIEKCQLIEEDGKEFLVLPSGIKVRVHRAQDGSKRWFTSGEILWSLLSGAVSILGEEHTETQTLLGILWLLSARKSDISRRSNFLERQAIEQVLEPTANQEEANA